MRGGAFLIALTLVVGVPTSRAAEARFTADDAIKAYKEGTLAEFGKGVEDGLRAELGKRKPADEAVVRLAAMRSFAVRAAVAKLAGAEDGKTLEWVVRDATLGPMLFTALSPHDDFGRVISVLTALRAGFGRTVEQFPDLAVATSVVWDSPSREGQTPEEATRAACEVFGHLTRNRSLMRFDPQALPWPVLVYLVDSRASVADRRWALDSFKLPAEPGRAYFMVAYDMSAFSSGTWRGGDYTLANILKTGGVCKDQAYFAAEVARAYGIPATVCTGSSGAGEGFHAWVGMLRIARRQAAWDFETARYADHGFWSGTVIDPQTGEKLADGEVALAGEWCATKAERRLLSLAMSQSLDLVEPAQRIAACKAALEAGPGNQQAWMALVKECAQPGTPIATVHEVAEVVERFAVGRYDDFAFKMLTSLIAALEPAQQLDTLDRAARVFPKRPDLLAELALRKGDALRKAARPVDALKMYQQVLQIALQYGPIALDAMARVDGMLRPAGKTKELLEHYRVAWTRMAKPEASGYAWTTPWYIMGERYAKVLEETGDKAGAGRVRGAIRKADLSHHDDPMEKK